ncbi:MAG TPA: hypothetical protein VG649_11090 [Candidatus Angelobacter sp.]|nr:hypothetical protein [Candidatus Angelobacter sp.]
MRNVLTSKLGLSLAALALCFDTVAVGAAAAQAKNAKNIGQQNEIQQTPSLNDASGKAALAIYKNFTQYPPDSRPLDASNWDLLHPWSTDTAPLPMVPRQTMLQMDVLRASGMTEEEVLRNVTIPTSLPKYQFEMNKTILAGTKDELRAKLTVIPNQVSPPIRMHIIDAQLIGDEDFGAPKLGRMPFSCESAATCTFQWKAPSAQKEYWGVLELVVTATVEGTADDFVIRQPFYSSPMVAGKFTGQFQERIDNGSLVIDAGVEVQKRMACFVSANLYSVDRGIPTHHAERRMIVDPSMKTIGFTFFGKVFRDFGHEGMFRLQDLKAQCENLAYPPEWFLDSVAHQAELQNFQSKAPTAREPSRIYFEYNNFSFTTHRYTRAAFSDREWQSPESAHKLEMLKKAATDLDNPAMDERKRQLQTQPK